MTQNIKRGLATNAVMLTKHNRHLTHADLGKLERQVLWLSTLDRHTLSL